MAELNELKTKAELGSTCSRTHPSKCSATAEYEVRLVNNNAHHRELREIVVLACGPHFEEQKAKDPESMVAWRHFRGPAQEAVDGR